MDILDQVVAFRKGRKIIKDLTIKARNGDTAAALNLMSGLAIDATDEKKLIDNLVNEVKRLRKKLGE